MIQAVSICLIAFATYAAGCQSATTLIQNAEGFRACTYVDTTGHKTICYGVLFPCHLLLPLALISLSGFNLDANGAEAKVKAVGGDWDSVYNHGGWYEDLHSTSPPCFPLTFSIQLDPEPMHKPSLWRGPER